MRRAAIVAIVLFLAVALFFMFREAPELPSQRPVESIVQPLALQRAPIEGAPCRIDGLVYEGVAFRVRIRSQRARIDFEARLHREGHAYSAELPEQGNLQVVAVSQDGRTVAAEATCTGNGRLQLDLHFPPPHPLAAILEGRCTYLDTGFPVSEAVVRGSLSRGHGRFGEVLWSALTDEEGRFELSVPPGSFGAQCGKDGDDGEPVRVQLPPNGRVAVELFVEARASIAGIIVDAVGEPVSSVPVAAGSPGRRERQRSESDQDGRFIIRDLEPGAVIVEAHHRGSFAEAHTVAQVQLPYAEVRLQLAEGPLGIAGVVRGDDGPLAGASVEAFATGRGSERAPIERATVTDDEGRFTIGGLVGGTYRITGRASGYSPGEAELEVQGGVVNVALTLMRACTTRLRVSPAEPKYALVVTVRPKEGEVNEAAGQTGQTIEVIGSSGRATISVRTVGSSVRTASISADLCGPAIEIVLPTDRDHGAIEASVVDKERAPVSGVHVWVERVGSGDTDAAGKVRFDGLEPGEYAVGARDVEPKRVEAQADTTAFIELVVERTQGRITGIVVARDAPVEGALVSASCSDSGWDRSREDAAAVARSGADGSFSFEPKNGGVCAVRAEHERFGRSEEVTLKTNGPPAEIALLAPATITGRVTETENRSPVERYAVTARSSGRGGDLELRTLYISDPSGQYRIDDVAPGRVSVTVTAEGKSAHREVELAPGETKSGVDFVVIAEGAVRGRVLTGSPKSAPIFGANVMVRALGRARGAFHTEADGRFSIKVPAGEPLRLFIRAADHYPWGSQPFDLSADGPTDLGDIVLKPRGGDEEKEGGLGIMFAGDTRGVRVIGFAENSPAREAGMEIGDLITAIDGVAASREPMVNWVVSLRGPAGTPVVLEVERGTMPPFTITVLRRSIGLDPVP